MFLLSLRQMKPQAVAIGLHTTPSMDAVTGPFSEGIPTKSVTKIGDFSKANNYLKSPAQDQPWSASGVGFAIPGLPGASLSNLIADDSDGPMSQ
jgi:hypothetical protein